MILIIIRLLSLLETYSQNVIFDELDKTFIENNLAVSIVNKPTSRTEPIIGFSFGMYNIPKVPGRRPMSNI